MTLYFKQINEDTYELYKKENENLKKIGNFLIDENHSVHEEIAKHITGCFRIIEVIFEKDMIEIRCESVMKRIA